MEANLYVKLKVTVDEMKQIDKTILLLADMKKALEKSGLSTEEIYDISEAIKSLKQIEYVIV